MNKRAFLQYLRWKLRRYSKEEAENAVNYYDELISDKVREGMSETEAVASLGDKREVVKNLISTMDVETKKGEGHGHGGALVAVLLAVLASPLLFPLGIVFIVVVFVVFTVWISLVVSFGAVAIGGLVWAVGNWFSFAGIANALVQTGIGLVTFVVFACLCVALAYYGFKLVKKIVISLRNALFKRK